MVQALGPQIAESGLLAAIAPSGEVKMKHVSACRPPLFGLAEAEMQYRSFV